MVVQNILSTMFDLFSVLQIEHTKLAAKWAVPVDKILKSMIGH